MIIFELGVVGLALFGAFLNARGDRNGFIFWIFSNTYLCWKNLIIHEWAQAALFLAYLALALYGYTTWKKD